MHTVTKFGRAGIEEQQTGLPANDNPTDIDRMGAPTYGSQELFEISVETIKPWLSLFVLLPDGIKASFTSMAEKG
jgi:hypothetical protein